MKLIDMLIEEVSLVDKAANKLTFFLIKRDVEVKPVEEEIDNKLFEQILADLKDCKALINK